MMETESVSGTTFTDMILGILVYQNLDDGDLFYETLIFLNHLTLLSA
jgi:hypothetical protein